MRIRTIKPEFWTDKKVSTWDHFTRLLFIGLWSAADDHGRGSAEAARLASELFPYDLTRDPSDTLARVAAGLDTLSEASRIVLYEVEGEVFYEVSSWSKHQRVDNAGKPRVPTPSEGLAKPSLKSRETRGDLPLEQGTGNREQGVADSSADKFADARTVLARLNELTHREFRAVDSNLKLIKARLSEPDVTVEGLVAMVERQVAKWNPDPKMREYLRPETLFGKTKFDGYYAARNEPVATRPQEIRGASSSQQTKPFDQMTPEEILAYSIG